MRRAWIWPIPAVVVVGPASRGGPTKILWKHLLALRITTYTDPLWRRVRRARAFGINALTSP